VIKSFDEDFCVKLVQKEKGASGASIRKAYGLYSELK